MKEQIEELRLEIDSLAELINSLLPFKGVVTPWRYISKGAEGNNTSFELYEAEKSLLLAKAWMGKLLGELGGTTPYKNDGNRHSVGDIEPTDAKSVRTLDNIKFGNTSIVKWSELNHVERVDKLRGSIQNDIDRFLEIDTFKACYKICNPEDLKDSDLEDKAYQLAANVESIQSIIYQHLTEARLHLGFELGRIRDTADGSK